MREDLGAVTVKKKPTNGIELLEPLVSKYPGELQQPRFNMLAKYISKAMHAANL